LIGNENAPPGVPAAFLFPQLAVCQPGVFREHCLFLAKIAEY